MDKQIYVNGNIEGAIHALQRGQMMAEELGQGGSSQTVIINRLSNAIDEAIMFLKSATVIMPLVSGGADNVHRQLEEDQSVKS